MSNSCFSTFSWLADCKASAIAESSIGKMNAVFPPWPIREFRDRSDGIPESGREDRVVRGARAFFGRTDSKSELCFFCSLRKSSQLLESKQENVADALTPFIGIF